MEDPSRYCENVYICLVSTLAVTVVAFYVGVLLARVNQLLLPLLLTLSVYPGFLRMVSSNRLSAALVLVYSWVLVSSLLMINSAFTGLVHGGLVAKGEEYVREMFEWIKTSRGAEGNPSLFFVPKVVEVVVFSLATLLTVGFAGLLMGAYLLDYMNFYVGVLLTYAKPGHFLEVALLSWQVYAILRVLGYVMLGTALTRVSWLLVKERRVVVEEGVKRLLVYALALIALDFILKGTVANALYQPLLKACTALPP
ncbi:hypothetical protein IG193_01445 [Infirmifilum lucidum]|uniref:Uncharacterized protein n=1 Tax=Infirmifilum lucidum TaxID=2776706 RepID=A0A7L9FJP6_9CREN|nr:hypothetical protein [Infirmifilum lucidum]QOJ79154.1 hypothetical protein IG193_01445 [Infirmifilum lucidum]